MKTLKNNFRNLDLQLKALIIATIVLTTVFTTMTILNGFSSF